ncbi:DNA internalization-related competence protein ComEC/Rec2 [Apilactobacillus xinyiensis]|uniref:DNA internalization-related competence protein ComEC/Rec2 n=1 Tax=Apilactobacillus xinyiensis TaxID=2841032 RepID=A0ABT0I1X0_9LACO|nr:DNA internalization-related competence protein ComEC/Rec2 [Apilactobacillus xinyiensis]MCK8624716.1 DNA internalization-related competence protein ComEC/Rec2 [Apilactobacillus xinyiensis]MCL0318831.1 DNA internalization-related competence protein ComEC/Rec2 [Apilactobacillus xinyiensis]MCL0329927.1 DNA internalization-related competence protein ComEC/Rec2 [Apilactobacillus xinyiensis]
MILKIYPDEMHSNNDYFYGKAFYNNKRCLIKGNKLPEICKTSLIRVNADICPVEDATNFNQFSTKKHNSFNGIQSSIKINKIYQLNSENSFSILSYLHDFRFICLKFANDLPKPLDVYTKSLIFGEMDNSFSEELTGIKTLGLIHLFSISGLHVYFLVMFIRKALYVIGFHKELVDKLIIIVLPLFFILAGSSVGLLRSILLVELSIILKLFHLNLDALNLFSIVLILHIFYNPQMLFQFGCQLSYALSLGLLFLKDASNFKLTVFMNFISLPFVLYHTYEWHLLTILANFLVIPIFSLVIMPIVLIGNILFFICLPLCKICAFALEIFDNLINYVASVPGVVHFGKPNIIFILVMVYFTLKTIIDSNVRVLFKLFGVYLLGYINIHCPLNGEVSFFDVGQGDSFLVRTPFNRSVSVIDTGGKITFFKNQTSLHNYSALKTSINYLKSIGVSHIDNLCISHQDDDHCGDLPAFLTNMKVNKLILPLGINENKRFMNKIIPNIGHTKLVFVKNGDKIKNFPFVIYHPFNRGIGNNDDSMVLWGKFNKLSFLFMGDLSSKGENNLLNCYPNIESNVLKLGHHGSKNSSSNSFLSVIKPKLGIISAGRHNMYNHPNDETIKRLDDHQITYLSTQDYGMISYCYSIFGNDKWVSHNKGGGFH